MTVYLSILIFLPLAAAVVGLLLPTALVRAAAIAGTVLALIYAVIALADFDSAASGLQFVTNDRWIPSLGIRWKLGIDGLNLFLVLLTTVLWTASTIWASLREWERPKLFFFHLALAETAVLGALLAQDLALFVIFFDLMLVPFFFLTGQWGSGDRVRATIKLVIYTLVGSLLMLSAAVATGVLSATGDQSVTFEISALAQRTLPAGTQDWIFLFFAAAFLVKMPAFPLHGWMPDGYSAMPMPVLAVFSGVLSKVAAYGFLRICLPLFPDASVHYQEFMLVLALLSILYGSVMAFSATNARLVLGYSSVAQLGFIVLGIFALRDTSTQGAILQAVNHGLVVVPAFFVVALLAERVGSEDLRDMGGLALRAPVLAALALIVTFGVLAMPGSSNFIGEFMILLGAFQSKIVFAFVASTGVVLAAVYALRLFITAFHNNRGVERVESREISLRDSFVLVPLVLVHHRAVAVPAARAAPQRALRDGVGGGRAGDPDRRAGRVEGGAVIETPTIDWAGLSPLIALLGGALARPRRRPRPPALGARGRRAVRRHRELRAAIGLSIWQWGERKDLMEGALRLDELTLVAHDDLLRRGHRGDAAGLARTSRRARRPTASSTACCSARRRACSCSSRRRTSSRSSSASSCCRSRSTSCARPRRAARARWKRG